jgi:hypothetical protein
MTAVGDGKALSPQGRGLGEGENVAEQGALSGLATVTPPHPEPSAPPSPQGGEGLGRGGRFFTVIPAKAGIQGDFETYPHALAPGLRRGDDKGFKQVAEAGERLPA